MVPRLPNNATNEEIINYVRHYYPDLGPLLRMMFERLQDAEDQVEVEKLSEENEILREQNAAIRKERLDMFWEIYKPTCPHCGSKMPFPDEAKD